MEGTTEFSVRTENLLGQHFQSTVLSSSDTSDLAVLGHYSIDQAPVAMTTEISSLNLLPCSEMGHPVSDSNISTGKHVLDVANLNSTNDDKRSQSLSKLS